MERFRNSVEFQVSGKFALFSDVLTRSGGEKCSYTIPTYEALKGILQSVYWKPTFIWIIDDVRIMNPIKLVRKGERPIAMSGGNDLSYYTYLADVCYQVRAHFIWNENRPELMPDRNENKHHNVAKRMIERGGRRDIFLGTRECQGYVEPCVFGQGAGAYDNVDMSFSLMLHGITYADEATTEDDKGMLTVRFWQPEMKKGVITFIKPCECAVKRHIHKMDIKPFGIDKNFSLIDENEVFGGDYELGK